MKFQACPDFKGIKTKEVSPNQGRWRFQACPDFKGIKTLYLFKRIHHEVSSLP